MADFAKARRNMVDCQLRTNKVVEPALIEAFATVPRERFVEPHRQAIAYVDEDVPVGNRRYLMEPMVFARILQALAIGPDDIVLDVGCATGYSTAILSQLAATVVALESDHDLATRANSLLTELSADNAVVVEGPLADGYAAQGPYDVIWIGGGVAEITADLKDQLAEGGRLATVIDRGSGAGEAILMLKRNGIVSQRSLFDANVPRLPGFERKVGFVF